MTVPPAAPAAAATTVSDAIGAPVTLPTPLPDYIVAATRRGELKKIIKWLRKEGDVNAQRTSDGNSLLQLCVIMRQPDLVRELLNRGAAYDVANHSGSTSLMAAAQLGATLEAQLLVKAGADVNKQSKYGSTALMVAASTNKPELLLLLLGHSADVDTTSIGGSTALMVAALEGHAYCVHLLLDAGASVETQNCAGQTALKLAEVKGHAKTQLLLQGSHPDEPLALPSEPIAADAVRLRLSDGRLVTVPERALRQQGRKHTADADSRRQLLSRAVQS